MRALAVEHQLIQSGPYRFVRHPIYTAVLGMYVGTMLVSGQVHALAGIALVTLAYWRKIGMEERVLAGAFGSDHDEYRRRTWAWIPGIF